MVARDLGRHLSLSFSGDRPLRTVLEGTLAACRRLALAEKDEARLCVIVEELLVNLYEHGGIEPGGMVRLALRRSPGSMHLVLEDSGCAFDPRLAPGDLDIPERGGGARLNIVRQWAERLSYAAGPPLNRLELWIPSSPIEPGEARP